MKTKNKVIQGLVTLLCSAIIIGGIWLCFFIKWQVYHSRYPDASFWTMFFK